MSSTKQLIINLQQDNEIVINGLLNIIRQNIDLYDFGNDKAKFLQEKKKQIKNLLQQYDEKAIQCFNQELFKLNSRQVKGKLENQNATENRAFVDKIKYGFDRAGSHNKIKNKNLGLIDA